jgi:hypothetical protein
MSTNRTAVNLKCEDLYQDFETACWEVINTKFDPDDKMNKKLIYV